jgi:hypothetical protein
MEEDGAPPGLVPHSSPVSSHWRHNPDPPLSAIPSTSYDIIGTTFNNATNVSMSSETRAEAGAYTRPLLSSTDLREPLVFT